MKSQQHKKENKNGKQHKQEKQIRRGESRKRSKLSWLRHVAGLEWSNTLEGSTRTSTTTHHALSLSLSLLPCQSVTPSHGDYDPGDSVFVVCFLSLNKHSFSIYKDNINNTNNYLFISLSLAFSLYFFICLPPSLSPSRSSSHFYALISPSSIPHTHCLLFISQSDAIYLIHAF